MSSDWIRSWSLSKKIKEGLLKMDAQGFECKILEGMGGEVAEQIDVMKFEYADHWLFAHGCMDLLPRVMNYSFDVYRDYENGAFTWMVDGDTDLGTNVIIDLIATKKS